MLKILTENKFIRLSNNNLMRSTVNAYLLGNDEFTTKFLYDMYRINPSICRAAKRIYKQNLIDGNINIAETVRCRIHLDFETHHNHIIYFQNCMDRTIRLTIAGPRVPLSDNLYERILRYSAKEKSFVSFVDNA